MSALRRMVWATGWLAVLPSLCVGEDLPKVLDARLKLELFAENPRIVTPTGIDVDHQGRVWAIESNTHFPPDGYPGHPSDRVLVMEDADRDGKADRITVFRDGLTHTMSVAVKPLWLDLEEKRTVVFIATRKEVVVCIDTDGDLKCDQTKSLLKLDTAGNYPHNGIGGFAFDALGNLFFGFGENLGADYTIIGSDGITLSGGGEGGSIYRCQPDGSKLQRWATGFWNPHASCIDAFGRMFSVDNDPDSRPPCRLMHIIQGGDYGYRFRNGRKGTHPFTSWNGEIIGTLPMVAGTGEAPSGIVSYESDGLPDDYLGKLLVGSWGDHRIDKFVLQPRGSSFVSFPQPVIIGDENFRPVGLAVAPDGSLYFTDWVSKEYKIHGKGRVWRLSMKAEPKRVPPDQTAIRDETSVPQLRQWLSSPSLVVRRTAARKLHSLPGGCDQLTLVKADPATTTRSRFEAESALNKTEHSVRIASDLQADPFEFANLINELAIQPHFKETTVKYLSLPGTAEVTSPDQLRYNRGLLLAARRNFPNEQLIVRLGFQHQDPIVQRICVQWVGEEHLQELRPEVEKVLASEPISNDLFLACLASLSLLDGVAPAEFEKTPPSQYLLAIVQDANRPANLRATALRILPASQKELDAKLLDELLSSADPSLRRETVRTLQHSLVPQRDELLRPIAANEKLDSELRNDAIAGLTNREAGKPWNVETRDLLIALTKNGSLEAIRSLRGPLAQPEQPNHDPRVVEALRNLRRVTEKLIRVTPDDGSSDLLAAIDFALGKRTEKKPTSEDLWTVNVKPSTEAGCRTFFHSNSAGCHKCHAIGGRGGQIGPDLTFIARTMDRKKLLDSILEPSQEISPQYTTWNIETVSGSVIAGTLLGEELNEDLRLANNQGEIVLVPFREIESRHPSKISLMPDRLYESLTPAELRDLIEFLLTLK